MLSHLKRRLAHMLESEYIRDMTLERAVGGWDVSWAAIECDVRDAMDKESDASCSDTPPADTTAS